MGESWKPILKWEGYYEVSDRGRIRSVDRFVRHSGTSLRRELGRIMSQHSNENGYLYVMASKHGQTKRIWVHRAVLEAFVSSRPRGMVTMHLNNDPADNHVENLRWGTQAENIRQSVRDGRQANVRKKKCSRGHEFHDWNLAPAALRQGKRSCLACYKVTHIHRVKEVGEAFVQLESDNNYRELRLANLQKSQ